LLARETTAPVAKLAALADQRDRSSYMRAIVAGWSSAVVCDDCGSCTLYHGRVRTRPPWDCGFPLQTPRMQDTAEGFGQPIRQIFEPFFRIERHCRRRSISSPATRSRSTTISGAHSTCPSRAEPISWPDRGNDPAGPISIYLTYSFCTCSRCCLRAMSAAGRPKGARPLGVRRRRKRRIGGP
jgi:hypothetical protein